MLQTWLSLETPIMISCSVERYLSYRPERARVAKFQLIHFAVVSKTEFTNAYQRTRVSSFLPIELFAQVQVARPHLVWQRRQSIGSIGVLTLKEVGHRLRIILSLIQKKKEIKENQPS